jgi:hypothetical protein
MAATSDEDPSMPRAAEARKAVKLRQSVNHDLTVYALAASAAGVGVLALAQPAAAEIVYTSTHQTIRPNHMFAIDLNHDGKIDFTIDNIFRESHGGYIYIHSKVHVKPAAGAAIVSSGPYHYGAVVKKGETIGPQAPWASRLELMDARAIEFGYTFYYGNWQNIVNGYLGLRFQIDGQDHYGWARVSVQWEKGRLQRKLLAEVTGYAYETEANTPIIAGDTGGANAGIENSGPGSETAVTFQPEAKAAILGALSLGSSGLAIWRRP